MRKEPTLHDVAQVGPVVKVARFLAKNPALIDAVDSTGQTALHCATKASQVKIVELLLARCPALTDGVDKWGKTALHYASQSGNDEIVARLLAHKPELIEVKDTRGMTALHCAAEKGHDHIMARLLGQGAHFDKNTPKAVFILAAFNGRDEEVEAMLLADESSDETSNDEETQRNMYWTAFHLAAMRGHDKVVARLLARIPVLIEDTAMLLRNPLHYAAEGGQAKTVAQLLAHNPRLAEGKTALGQNPLHVAALYGHDDVVCELLAHAPHLIDSIDHSKQTALHCAAEGGHIAVVRRLLAVRPSLIHAVDFGGGTALFRAADYARSSSVVEMLLFLTPEQVYRQDSKGNTLLHLVTWSKELTEKVWAMNPQAVHVANKHGDTPLVCAVAFDHRWAIECFQWKLPLETISDVFADFRCRKDRDCIRLFAEEAASLHRDLFKIVYDFLVQSEKLSQIDDPPN